MAKKKTNQKILLLTDSASDLSDHDLQESGIVMLPIPITIDGKGYFERVDFTTTEFYDKLAAARELPSTSHILSITYQQAYEDAFAAGFTDIINVTIASVGSNMFQAAVMAKKTFFAEHPQAKETFHITVLDSGSYSLGYGFPLMEASKLVKSGKTAAEVVDYLDDYFSTAEIYFAAYSLEYAKKSGRIPAATAFVGDMLGLRPIISIIDGKTTVEEKVRGDRNVVTHIVDRSFERCGDKKAPYATVFGCVEQYGDDIRKAASKKFGHAPKMTLRAGASITINSGPKVVGIVVRGEKRFHTRASEKDYLEN